MLRKLSKTESIVHALIGGTIVLLLILFKPQEGANINFYTLLALNVFFGVIAFYSHLLWLIPTFLAQKKYSAYFSRATALFIGIGIMGLASFAGLDALIDVMPLATSWSLELAMAISLAFIAEFIP